MSTTKSKWLAYAQLMRLPNLFTAVADPLAGWFIARGESCRLPAVLAISGCLYTAGLVLNDYFDYKQDCVDRPERPLPRGAISLKSAWVLGVVLFLTGGILAVPVGGMTQRIVPLLSILILFYNLGAKRSAILGPVTLGGCRALNFALGLGGFLPTTPLIYAGVYVTGLSFIARQEEARPELRRLVKRLLQGIIVVDAALVFALTGDWQAAALVLSLLVPAVALGRILAMT